MKPEERERLEMIRNRVDGLMEAHAHDISENRFLRISAKLIEEAKFLLNIVDRHEPRPRPERAPKGKGKGAKGKRQEPEESDLEALEV